MIEIIIFKEEMFTFKRNSLPVARSIHYQLIDIQLDEVQQMVHSNDGQVSFHLGKCQANAWFQRVMIFNEIS